MKLSLGFCCLLGMVPALSRAASDGFFIDGAAGSTTENSGFSSSDDAPITKIDFGYRWDWFAIEAGYVDVGKISGQYNLIPNYSVGEMQKQHGYTAGVSGHWNLTPNWYVSGRVGAYSRQDVYQEIVNGSLTPKYRETDIRWHAGAGFGYDFNKNFGVGLDYDFYDGPFRITQALSAKAEVRF